MRNRLIFWEVDAQEDFMLPGGRLYVPGAEKIIPRIAQLIDKAEKSGALIISSACAHSPNDSEFEQFPPHCIKGTAGARIIPEGLVKSFVTIPSDPAFELPANFLDFPQLVLEKQMLDVFSNPHTAELLELIGPDAEFVVFGVVTEYCVRCAAQGLLDRHRKVSIIRDAVETLNADEGNRTLHDLVSNGARLIDMDSALALLA